MADYKWHEGDTPIPDKESIIMELQKGYLVRKKDGGELGIITGIGHRQGKAIVFWGDGLESETDCESLESILYHPRADILANFIELVAAFEHHRGYRHVYPSV